MTRPPAGPRLNATGRRLWDDLDGDKAAGGKRVLILEACRIADRLDKLDRLLSGDAADWLGFIEAKGDPDRQEVVIDKPLAEARQQATALKQIVSELRQSGANPASGKPRTAGGAGVAGVADLTARIARRAKPAG